MNELLLNVAYAIRPVCNFFVFAAASVLLPIFCVGVAFGAAPAIALSGAGLAMTVVLFRWMNG